MFSRSIIIGSIATVGILIAGFSQPVHATFAQSLEGSCYVATNGQFYIDVDDFTVQVNESSGERAAEFKLRATEIGSGDHRTLIFRYIKQLC